jgi:hypothetical protein
MEYNTKKPREPTVIGRAKFKIWKSGSLAVRSAISSSVRLAKLVRTVK